jgi:N-succinyldiaminopimelate aminotransferase
MSLPVQQASVAAWNDEAHVAENRRIYREKFAAALAALKPAVDVRLPDAAFYLWLPTPGADADFAQRLYREQAVSVLPGSYLGREAHGINPGRNRVRIALVAAADECVEAVTRIRDFYSSL